MEKIFGILWHTETLHFSALPYLPKGPRDQACILLPVLRKEWVENKWHWQYSTDMLWTYNSNVTSSLEAYYLRAKTRISRFWTKLCVTLDHCLTTALLKNVFCKSTLPQTASPILLGLCFPNFLDLPGTLLDFFVVSSCFGFVQSHTGSAPSQRGQTFVVLGQ
jgi:hypothetical protein